MVRSVRVELTTYSFGGYRSIQLSYERVARLYQVALPFASFSGLMTAIPNLAFS
jgi:hypothetical protein